APAQTGPPEWHRMQMRLSGSMCIACLKDLEDALRRLPGINRIRIERPMATFTQAVSPDVSNWAQGVVVYDEKRIPAEYLRNVIRGNGYHSYHIVDKELGRDPEDRDLKF